MYKHPMLSVKEAAAALGCDERWIREKLNQGTLKGEKRTIGLKDKWFVYKGEIDAALAKKGTPAVNATNVEEADSSYFGVEEETIDVKAESQSDTDNRYIAGLEEIVKVIANQFAEKLDQQKEFTQQLQRELEDKDRQLKLLPDLEKKLAEAQEKEFEMKALEKQLLALEEKKAEAQKAAEEIIEKISSEKDTQINQMQEELLAINNKLQELQKPWWKKWFSSNETTQS
ncbi:MAG: hypothetical protein SFY67_07455 [Candidatus Melainabacteria bacterium]|nr:hypothetical protein [Candidatus Melainabacteria bacterium]